MKHAEYRRQRVKHYEAMLARWRKLVADCPELVDDIRDLERHVNAIRSVTVEREASGQVGGPRRGQGYVPMAAMSMEKTLSD